MEIRLVILKEFQSPCIAESFFEPTLEKNRFDRLKKLHNFLSTDCIFVRRCVVDLIFGVC